MHTHFFVNYLVIHFLLIFRKPFALLSDRHDRKSNICFIISCNYRKNDFACSQTIPCTVLCVHVWDRAEYVTGIYIGPNFEGKRSKRRRRQEINTFLVSSNVRSHDHLKLAWMLCVSKKCVPSANCTTRHEFLQRPILFNLMYSLGEKS